MPTCLECKKPHAEETFCRTRKAVGSLLIPASFETLPHLLRQQRPNNGYCSVQQHRAAVEPKH